MMKDKIILITGGAGSLGQALVKLLLETEIGAIRVLDNNELRLADMGRIKDSRLRFMFGDIKDKDRLLQLFRDVDIVVHTAALKHVPICAYNPTEAVKTNCLGSINVLETAMERGVDKVIGISSDKAVHPINVYGSTKLVMEQLFMQASNYSNTKFSCIRFGNFWASAGSVVPLFDKQVEQGKKLTITHKDMTRFWITLDNAAQFTLQCIDRMVGSEIFIPKMSKQSIKEIVETLYPNTPYEIIGRRRGEKLNELLFAEGEKPEEFDNYFVVR